MKAHQKLPPRRAPLSSQSAARESKIIVEQARPAKHLPYGFAALLTLSAITLFFGLGSLAFIGPDEPRYAEVAREMFASGDYISPRLAGCLWFEKPVLLYWMAAAGYHLFGVTELAARFPSALAGLATVLTLYLSLRRAVSERLALSVSLVLATSGVFIGFARAAVFDMLLTAAMTASLLIVYRLGENRFLYWAVCFGALGVALLAKGLVGIALFFVISLIYLRLMRRLSVIRWQYLCLGTLILLAIASTWYLPMTLRHGWEFINKFIIEHHFRRYVTNAFSHPQPLYLYPVVIVGGLLPWTFFLLPAAARLRRLKPRADNRDSLLALAWVWLVVPLLFFSVSRSKLPGYILPVFPALAIIIGAEVEQLWSGERGGLHQAAALMTVVLLLALGVTFALIVNGTLFIRELNSAPVNTGGWRTILYLAPLLCGVFATASFIRGNGRALILSAAAAVASIVVGTVLLLFPNMNNEMSYKALSLETARALRAGERIGFFIKKEFAPVFYAEGRVVCGTGDGTLMNALHPDRLVPVLEIESSLVVITTTNWLDDLEADPRFAIEPVAKQGEALAVRVSLK